jgi:hypothetical protein
MPGKNKWVRKAIPWWLWILGVDLFLLTTTALKQYPLSFPGKSWLVRHFNLAVEMNAAVWWSAICLLAVALLAYELYSSKVDRGKFAWLSLAVVFACLSLDELGSIHERVGSWSNLLPFGVVFVSLVAFALGVLFRNPGTRRSALFIGAGVGLFGSVALQEYLEDAGFWSSWALGLRVAVEEGSELLGILLIFFGIVSQRDRSGAPSLRAIIPDPTGMKKLPEIVLIGWFAHTLASITLPGLIDVGEKGNPLAWYPAAAFFILFAAAQGFSNASASPPKMLKALAVFFLFCSTGLAYDPPRLLPVIGSLVPRDYLTGAFFLSISGLLLLIGGAIPDFWARNCRYLPLLLLLPLAALLDTHPEIQFLTAGVMSLLVFTIFRRYERNAADKKKPEISLSPEISAATLTPTVAQNKTGVRSTAVSNRK